MRILRLSNVKWLALFCLSLLATGCLTLIQVSPWENRTMFIPKGLKTASSYVKIDWGFMLGAKSINCLFVAANPSPQFSTRPLLENCRLSWRKFAPTRSSLLACLGLGYKTLPLEAITRKWLQSFWEPWSNLLLWEDVLARSIMGICQPLTWRFICVGLTINMF